MGVRSQFTIERVNLLFKTKFGTPQLSPVFEVHCRHCGQEVCWPGRDYGKFADMEGVKEATEHHRIEVCSPAPEPSPSDRPGHDILTCDDPKCDC